MEVVQVGGPKGPVVTVLKNREPHTTPLFEVHRGGSVGYHPEQQVDAEACHEHFFVWKVPQVGCVRPFPGHRLWALPAAAGAEKRRSPPYVPPRFLRAYWSAGHRDSAAVAKPETEQALLDSLGDPKHEYLRTGVLCAVESCAALGNGGGDPDPTHRTRAVVLLKHPRWQDSRLVAEDGALKAESLEEGYEEVGVEFYTFVKSAEGRRALQLYFSEKRKDSAVAVEGTPRAAALEADGYAKLKEALGFVYWTDAAKTQSEADEEARKEAGRASPDSGRQLSPSASMVSV